MNLSKLKTYAPKARRDFIRAMTDRAAIYGLTEKTIEPVTENGDVAIIAGKAYPISVAAKRKLLDERVKRHGFEQTMEAMAYTWFNRFAAIRFMELHGYLDHGYRVLSHPEGNSAPEIVEHAEHVDMPGLDKNNVIELKLEGTKEAELYRLLLIAQCNALHSAMPFLFERIDDETELLLPDNLLHSDSLIRQLVNEIDEADWQEVQIIGWLYQFYISEKKDEVIGKVVKSEDIPAATQLFTPNWMVKYLVQNSLGRQWLATYPNSPLKSQMEYYIESAEQTPEVYAKLAEITPKELNPEELTLMDPACGSGHILVEGYDIFKAIYQERGYRAKDIPRLILEKNLFGLEIDNRAAQLAAFALMMKARADNRRIFDSEAKPNILAIQDSKGINAHEITEALNQPLKGVDPVTISQVDVAQLIDTFEHGTTFGSLIRIPDSLAKRLPVLAQRVKDVIAHGAMLEKTEVGMLRPLIEQATLLTCRFKAIVTNPPYLNTKGMQPYFKSFAQTSYPKSKSDTFAMFLERAFDQLAADGIAGFVTPFVWMFLSSYNEVRSSIVEQHTLLSLIQLEYNAFEPACVPVCTFLVLNTPFDALKADFIRLCAFRGHTNQPVKTLEAIRNPRCGWRFLASSDDFRQIPGEPLAYWLGPGVLAAFKHGVPLGNVCKARSGLKTWDNERFLRLWFEVSISDIHSVSHSPVERQRRWVPYNKGGPARRWNNHTMFCVDWQDNGREIRKSGPPTGEEFYFREGITWSGLTSGEVTFRYAAAGHIFDTNKGPMMFPSQDDLPVLLGLLSSKVVSWILPGLNPTLGTQNGDIDRIPVLFDRLDKECVRTAVNSLISLCEEEWNEHEFSRFFTLPAVLRHNHKVLSDSVSAALGHHATRSERIRLLEEQNNQLFVEAYGLAGTVNARVDIDDITIEKRNKSDEVCALLSFAIGCMMGRFSLDKQGIIYAHSGSQGFDPSKYKSFPADEDGIIPLTEFSWFPDDAARLFETFIATAWPAEYLEENLKVIADGLESKKGESSRETIRRYFAVEFFKDHLQTFKGPKHPPRPIYWLFSSGKQRAFQCLVYLHRYNEGTLSRMRTEYVIPLQGKMSARIEQLAGDIAAASSTAFRSKLTKERDKLVKQQGELQAFDEKLRHYADLRISLDLNDGVKVNYGKFGDLLADVKVVTGGSEE